MIGFGNLDLARARLVTRLDALAPNQGADVLAVMEAIDHLIQIRMAMHIQNSRHGNEQ